MRRRESGKPNPVADLFFGIPSSWPRQMISAWMMYFSGQFITTSAEVTPNGGLVRDSSQNPLNSGLGIILICPDVFLLDPEYYSCVHVFSRKKTPPPKGIFQLVFYPLESLPTSNHHRNLRGAHPPNAVPPKKSPASLRDYQPQWSLKKAGYYGLMIPWNHHGFQGRTVKFQRCILPCLLTARLMAGWRFFQNLTHEARMYHKKQLRNFLSSKEFTGTNMTCAS